MTMSKDASPGPAPGPGTSLSWLWWLLPIAEASVLSAWIDTGSLDRADTWWARIIANGGAIVSVVLISVAAGALIVWARWTSKKRPVPDPAPSSRPGWVVRLLAVGHLFAFVLFASLSHQLIGAGQDGGIESIKNPPQPGAWAFWGLAAALLWALAALRPSAWLSLIRRWWGEALTAVGVGVAAWYAGTITGDLWVHLQQPTFQLVRLMLGPLDSPDSCDPARYALGTDTFAVTIDKSCSGYQGIGLVLVALGAYLWLFRRRLKFPRALLLLPIGTVAIWLANSVRIALLIVVGTYISPDIAVGGFHSQVGWLMFIAVALGLMAGSQKLSFFARPVEDNRSGAVEEQSPAQRTNPTARYLLPLMVMVLAKMLTGAFSAGFDYLYALVVAATAAALLPWWPRVLRAMRVRDVWSAEAFGIGAAVFGLWLVCERLLTPAAPGSDATIAEGLAAMPVWAAAAWLAARVVGAVVTVPLAEELAFRGYLMRRLSVARFEQAAYRSTNLLAVAVSSVLFGAMHGRYVAGSLAGLLFAYTCWRRGRLADAVIAHAVANALLAAYVLITGRYALW